MFLHPEVPLSQTHWSETSTALDTTFGIIYVKAKVGNPTIELTPDHEQIHVTIAVSSLANDIEPVTVDIDGDLLEEKSVLMKKVKLVLKVNGFQPGRCV